MRIKRIDLKNFRGIEEASLSFSEHINVIVGINGAGKSTVLDGLALLLTWPAARLVDSQGDGAHIPLGDISVDTRSARLSIIAESGGREICWSLTRDLDDPVHPEGAVEGRGLNDFPLTSESGRSHPLFIYYPVHRAVIDVGLYTSSGGNENFPDGNASSLIGGADFGRFFEWFCRCDERGDSSIKVVRHALERFMPELSDFQVRRDPLRMVARKEGKEFSIDQLSDGEKCLVATVGDLSRRLAQANPAMDDPLQAEAVILIDEIELHLHPAWQRRIIPRLRHVFPQCQFIVSTHSPQVISHVKADDIFLLRQREGRMEFLRPEESYGKNSDRILEDMMDTDSRPGEVKDDLKELYDLIEDGQLDGARRKIALMSRTIGADPDLVRADVLIRRKEFIGR